MSFLWPIRKGRSGLWGLALVLATILGSAAPLLAAEESKPHCDGKLEDCLEFLANKMKSSGWVGVELEIDDETGINTVLKVLEGSPAEAAGIQVGDRLVAVNGIPFAEFRKEMLAGNCASWKPGQSVTYTIQRGEVDKKIRLILAPMPAEVLARYIGEHIQMHAGETQKDKGGE